ISPNERAAQEVKAAIWTRRGDAALERDDLEAALAAYREAGDAGKIARVEVLQRRRELAALEAQAQAHERAERWAEATAVYEQLLAQAPDEENQAAWQTALERCREEEELVCLFAEGVGALEQQDWKEAERAFAEVMHHRPDYRRDGQPAARLLQRALSRETVAVPRRQYIQHLAIVLVAAVLLLVVGMWAANTFYFQPREVTRQAEATAQAVALATAARQTAVAQAATATAHAVTPQAATATAQAVALAATATADACRDITLYTLEVAPEPTLSPQPGRIYIIGTQCPVVQATWVVTNTGECPWKDVMLQPLAGGEAVEPILRRGEEEVERVEPGEQVEVVLEFPVHQARDVDREWVIKVGEFSLYDQTHLRLEVTDWVVVVTPTPTPTPCLPHALFVDDVTVPDGAIFAPEESFTKMWRVRSTGCWPPDTALVFVRGDQLGAPESVPVPDTPLGSTVDIAVKMVAPDTPGIYNGVWRMQTPDGTLFGDWFYVLIEVALPTPTVIP
ncbi:MAG: hypothetical protein IMY86_12885, partial [Chloroflexi bacterium]|nr:hypothetical protein [Chloroflexota bacterium]